MGVHAHPAITINNSTYRGDMDAEDIAHAVCAGFKDRPYNCSHDALKGHMKKLEEYYFPEYGNSMTVDLLVIGLLIIVINLVIIGICKWRQISGRDRSQVEMEVNQQVQ